MLIWSEVARAQLRELGEALAQSGPAVVGRFRADLGSLLRLIEELPAAFPKVRGASSDVRHALLRRYQHWLIFRQQSEDEIEILAVWPTHRHPAGWKRRP